LADHKPMTGLSSGGITSSPLVGRVTKVDAGANESISWPRVLAVAGARY